MVGGEICSSEIPGGRSTQQLSACLSFRADLQNRFATVTARRGVRAAFLVLFHARHEQGDVVVLRPVALPLTQTADHFFRQQAH